MSKVERLRFDFVITATGTGRTYGLLPPNHVYLRDTILLTSQTDQPPGSNLQTANDTEP